MTRNKQLNIGKLHKIIGKNTSIFYLYDFYEEANFLGNVGALPQAKRGSRLDFLSQTSYCTSREARDNRSSVKLSTKGRIPRVSRIPVADTVLIFMLRSWCLFHSLGNIEQYLLGKDALLQIIVRKTDNKLLNADDYQTGWGA